MVLFEQLKLREEQARAVQGQFIHASMLEEGRIDQCRFAKATRLAVPVATASMISTITQALGSCWQIDLDSAASFTAVHCC